MKLIYMSSAGCIVVSSQCTFGREKLSKYSWGGLQLILAPSGYTPRFPPALEGHLVGGAFSQFVFFSTLTTSTPSLARLFAFSLSGTLKYMKNTIVCSLIVFQGTRPRNLPCNAIVRGTLKGNAGCMRSPNTIVCNLDCPLECHQHYIDVTTGSEY